MFIVPLELNAQPKGKGVNVSIVTLVLLHGTPLIVATVQPLFIEPLVVVLNTEKGLLFSGPLAL